MNTQFFLTALTTILLVSVACGRKEEGRPFSPPESVRTFTPPESPKGKQEEFLSALNKIGDEYKGYTMAPAQSPVEVRKLSITLINDLSSFDAPFLDAYRGQASLQMNTIKLGDKERSQITSAVFDTCTKHLEMKSRIDRAAPYRILIMLYAEGGAYFDSNQNPYGAMLVRVFFLDTSNKRVLWYHDTWGPGKSLDEAVVSAGSNINKQFDVLFGDAKPGE
jgi:hypothetical protein